MRSSASTSAAGSASSADMSLGFRRIDFIRLVVDEHGTTAEVTGVTHRCPHTIRVPLSVALPLLQAGVPRVLDTVGGARVREAVA